jgi:hypothetical protein
MKQLVHETNTLAISTVLLDPMLDSLDSLLGLNENHLPYETMVFPLISKGEPDFGSPLETKRYRTQAEAEAGHQAMIQKYAAPQ